MKVMESITSFLRRVDLTFRQTSDPNPVWGRLEQNLVASQKPVIVFEYPKILQAADSVEEATDFLLRAQLEGRVHDAAVYKHDTDQWRKVDTSRVQYRLTVEEPTEVFETTPLVS